MARINGEASLRTDASWLDLCSDDKRRPNLVIHVKVQEAYLHCSKAVMRSQIWDQEAQIGRSILISMGEMLKAQLNLEGPPESREDMRKRYLPIL